MLVMTLLDQNLSVSLSFTHANSCRSSLCDSGFEWTHPDEHAYTRPAQARYHRRRCPMNVAEEKTDISPHLPQQERPNNVNLYVAMENFAELLRFQASIQGPGQPHW